MPVQILDRRVKILLLLLSCLCLLKIVAAKSVYVEKGMENLEGLIVTVRIPSLLAVRSYYNVLLTFFFV